MVRLQRAAIPLRRLFKPRIPGVAARSMGLSAVAPIPISPLPQPLQRPELARGHESEKKVSDVGSSCLSIPLKPGGERIEVTDANKYEYVQFFVEHKLSHVFGLPITDQIASIREGLFELLEPTVLGGGASFIKRRDSHLCTALNQLC